jgi:hypothetical protein
VSDIARGKVWRARKNSTRFVEILEVGDGDQMRRKIKVQKTVRGKVVEEVFDETTFIETYKFAPDGAPVVPEDKPVAIAVGQVYADKQREGFPKLRVCGQGTRVGEWECEDVSTKDFRLIQESEVGQVYELVEDETPDDAVHEGPDEDSSAAPEIEPERTPTEDVADPEVQTNGTVPEASAPQKLPNAYGNAAPLRFEPKKESRVCCPCGDAHIIDEATTWDDVVERVARFKDRHWSCLHKNVLPFGAVA